MEKQFEFMNLSPLHMSTLLHRYDMVMELKEHVAATEKTFQHYAECGRQLCECMEKLSGTFQRYDEFKSDPALQSISELLIHFSSTLKSHYDQVDQHIITSLKTFIKKDIGRVEEDNRRVSHCIDTYNKLVEQFVQINKKKPGADQEEKEARMMASHWQAVYSSFMFNRSLDYVERKKLLEITGTMLMFINLVALAYKECLFSFDDAKDSFSNLQLALPVSSDEVNNFEKNTDILGKSLEGYYTLYWKRLKVSFTHTPAINHEGYLWKKGSGFTKSWQKRYFICQNHTLSYFHGTEDSDKPQGILPLLLTTVKPIKDPERRFCFTIISQEKVYVLQALTEWDMNEWIAVIQNNIQYLLDHSGEDIKETTTFTKDSSNDSPLSVECNCVCADCGAPNPVWCCINWGVCICINCSGVHRSLTTSVSKVRSLTLDRLDPTTNKLFLAIGNSNANSILEKNVGSEKINPGVTKEKREEYIRKKYLQMSYFANNGESYDMHEAIRDGNVLKVYSCICDMKKRQINPTNGYTPLHEAASAGNQLITLLLALNTDNLNALDEEWSALAYATYYNNNDAVEVLLQCGCNPNASHIVHPYQIAKENGNQAIIAMMLPYWNEKNMEQHATNLKPPHPLSWQASNDTKNTKLERYATINLLGAMDFQ